MTPFPMLQMIIYFFIQNYENFDKTCMLLFKVPKIRATLGNKELLQSKLLKQ